MPANNPVTTIRTDNGQGIENHRAEINAWANQVNAALAGATGAEAVDFVANFISLNSTYVDTVGQPGGLAPLYVAYGYQPSPFPGRLLHG